MPVLLVDAANVVGSRPDGWWRDRPGAARGLVARLAAAPPAALLRAAGAGTEDVQVVVVLEGAARPGVAEGTYAHVEVRHASASGDDLLAALAGPGTVLITADRGLRERARTRGAEVVGPRVLL
ncbi:MAG: hypothetical protein M3P46_11415, partial [Actinomycetota bacterium]|nr:hypothetical protein [Actinomycetota bacterium]